MNTLITDLTGIVGVENVLQGADVSNRPASTLGGSCAAKAIIRPASTEEISAVLKCCHQAGQPLVALGGQTGLAGGAIANEGEILLSLERMRQIEEIDETGRTLTAQAGVTIEAIQNCARDKALMFALDFGARGSATIGGALATNAGGERALRYGMARDMVLGLEVVLADGTVVSSMSKVIKDNTGYDLKQLFIGSEGTLGIVTRAVLRLYPRARSCNTAMVGVDSYSQVMAFFQFMDAALVGGLSGFEVMWPDFYEYVAEEGQHKKPLESGYSYYVLIEHLGSDTSRDAASFESAMQKAFEDGLLLDAVIAKSGQEREKLWEIREDVAQLWKLQPFAGFDISVPMVELETYLATVKQQLDSRWPGNRSFSFGHLGDNNLHFLVTVGTGDPDVLHEVETIVYQPLASLGGSISAEHGIGLLKRDYLGYSRNQEEIKLMRMLKNMLDPKNLLNPGKVIPEKE